MGLQGGAFDSGGLRGLRSPCMETESDRDATLAKQVAEHCAERWWWDREQKRQGSIGDLVVGTLPEAAFNT